MYFTSFNTNGFSGFCSYNAEYDKEYDEYIIEDIAIDSLEYEGFPINPSKLPSIIVTCIIEDIAEQVNPREDY